MMKNDVVTLEHFVHSMDVKYMLGRDSMKCPHCKKDIDDFHILQYFKKDLLKEG